MHNKMTHEEALEALKDIPSSSSEFGHMEADAILIELVRSLGYTEIAEEYERIGKWYS